MVVVTVAVLGYEKGRKRRLGGVSDSMATYQHPRRGEAKGG